jgi:hypothetical protein
MPLFEVDLRVTICLSSPPYLNHEPNRPTYENIVQHPIPVRMRETSCKWCELNAAVLTFENAPLCPVCPLKALHAIKHPQVPDTALDANPSFLIPRK